MDACGFSNKERCEFTDKVNIRHSFQTTYYGV